MKLVFPSARYKESFLSALEQAPLKEKNVLTRFETPELAKNDFTEFVRRLNGYRTGKFIPPNGIPRTVYWLVDHDQFIGLINIRHFTTKRSERKGGHIGFIIRKDMRSRGYGNTLLELGLEKARGLGFDKVLLTCKKTNTHSLRIIQKNKGTLESQTKERNRYSIYL